MRYLFGPLECQNHTFSFFSAVVTIFWRKLSQIVLRAFPTLSVVGSPIYHSTSQNIGFTGKISTENSRMPFGQLPTTRLSVEAFLVLCESFRVIYLVRRNKNQYSSLRQRCETRNRSKIAVILRQIQAPSQLSAILLHVPLIKSIVVSEWPRFQHKRRCCPRC